MNNVIDMAIERVRAEIKISSIIGQYKQLKKVGTNEYEALCDWHNDTRLGSFKISDKKNVCKCFFCGEGKDGISYFAFKENLNYVEAAMELAMSENMISNSDYQEFTKIKFPDKKAKEIERKYIKKDKQLFNERIAKDEVLNNVYTAFIKECILSNKHYKELKEKRFLSDSDINEDGYFTFPSMEIMRKFEERLMKDYGYVPSILKDVPGFYREKKTGKFKFDSIKGLGICIKNAKGLIVDIQIRLDNINSTKRYMLFSSARIEKDEVLSKEYDCGTAAKVRLSVIYPKQIKYKTIFITEGIFKARAIANTFGCVVISVQGVGNWKNISDEIKSIIKNISIVSFSNICIAYDADVAYNPQVFEQAMKMSKILKKNLPGFNLYYAMWHVDFGKGIDDLIYAGHKNMLESILLDKMEKLYNNFMNGVEGKYGNIVQNKVPKEILKEYFNRIVIKEDNFRKIITYIDIYNKKEIRKVG